MMKVIVGCFCFLSGILYVASSMLRLNKTECVEWHNKYRAIHQAPNVNWSKVLEDKAQGYAEELAKTNTFKHGSTGENLFKSGKDSKNSCEMGIKAFYKEEKYYNYDKPGFQKKAGHFTQLVWRGSTEIGVGKANNSKGEIILVYRYNPVGNMNYRISFANNVKPPVGKAFSHHASVVYCVVFGLTAMGLTVYQ